MTIRSSLFTGLNIGLRTSVLTKYGGSVFPTDAAGFAALAGNAAVTPSYIVPCQEASGSLVESITGATFAPTGSPLYAQPVSGLVEARNAISSASGAHFETSDNTIMDASGSVAHFFVFVNDGTSTGELMTKRGADGLFIRSLSTGGVWNFCDGSTTADYRANNNNSHTSGNAEAVWVVVNLTANTVRSFSSQGTEGPASIAGYGSFTTTNALRLLDGGGSGMAIAYYAGFEGAAAEAVTQTEFDNVWDAFTGA